MKTEAEIRAYFLILRAILQAPGKCDCGLEASFAAPEAHKKTCRYLLACQEADRRAVQPTPESYATNSAMPLPTGYAGSTEAAKHMTNAAIAAHVHTPATAQCPECGHRYRGSSTGPVPFLPWDQGRCHGCGKNVTAIPAPVTTLVEKIVAKATETQPKIVMDWRKETILKTEECENLRHRAKQDSIAYERSEKENAEWKKSYAALKKSSDHAEEDASMFRRQRDEALNEHQSLKALNNTIIENAEKKVAEWQESYRRLSEERDFVRRERDEAGTKLARKQGECETLLADIEPIKAQRDAAIARANILEKSHETMTKDTEYWMNQHERASDTIKFARQRITELEMLDEITKNSLKSASRAGGYAVIWASFCTLVATLAIISR